MVLDLGFSFLQLIAIFTRFHTLFFNTLFGSGDLGTVLTRDLFKLLLLQLIDFILVIVNVFSDFSLVFHSHSAICLSCIFLKAVTHAQLSLQQLDLGTVVPFIVVVALDSADDLLFHFFVGFVLLFILRDEVAVHIEPLIILDVVFVDAFLLHQ